MFLNRAAPTDLDTLSLHDALPISALALLHGLADPSEHVVLFLLRWAEAARLTGPKSAGPLALRPRLTARKSTRLNSSHQSISYAVYCLQEKTNLVIDDRNERQDSS